MKSHWRKLLAALPAKVERKYYGKFFSKEHQNWIAKGSLLPVSNLSKQQVLRQFQQAHNVDTLIETGTYLGDTLFALYDDFTQLYSIELSTYYYLKAKKRFKHLPKVELLNGDSGKVLHRLVPTLEGKAIFWLDGHYSGGLTAKGKMECPVYEELAAIFVSPFEHLIFIDDARLFTGQNSYPAIDQLQAFVQENKPDYHISLENDCIRLLPSP